MKRTVAAAVLGMVVACSAFVVTSGPAYAASCSASQITVVVQFPSRTEIGCAAGNVDSGYAALKDAGFDLVYARGNGSGAICRIDGYPGASCSSMPPPNAYWAYFRGKPGGGWQYSTVGGGSSNPDPGTVEGWRFQDTSSQTEPDVAPPAPASPSPSSAPTTKPTPKPTRGPAATAPASAAPDATATASGSATVGSSPSANASDLPLAASPADGATAATADPTDSTVAAAASDASVADAESSGGLSWIWGLVLLGVLAAGGGAVLVRRRG